MPIQGSRAWSGSWDPISRNGNCNSADAGAVASACSIAIRTRPGWRSRSVRFGAPTRRRCRVPASSTTTWLAAPRRPRAYDPGCTARSIATGATGCAEQVQRWAESGIQTVHCHNDGDYYDDGLFWRDGSYPPYPDMEKYDKVIADCHKAGIRTATYFSNKELHPSTTQFQQHGTSGAGRTAKETCSTTSPAPKASSARRCASAPAGSTS